MKCFSAHHAKQHFGEVIASVKADPVAITRYNRPIAFLLSARDFAEFIELRERAARADVAKALDDFEKDDGSRRNWFARRLLISLKNAARIVVKQPREKRPLR